MSPEISELKFEAALECGLLQGGPNACVDESGVLREAAAQGPPIRSGAHCVVVLLTEVHNETSAKAP